MSFSLNSVRLFQRRSWTCFSPSEAGAVILFFLSARKHKPGSGRWDIASSQVSLNYVLWFKRGSRKCLRQSDAGLPSCFLDRPKTQTWYRTLRRCFLSNPFNSVQRFQSRNVNDDGRTTDNAWSQNCTSLLLMCTEKEQFKHLAAPFMHVPVVSIK